MLVLPTLIIQATALAGLAAAHPDHEQLSARELVTRKEAATERHLVARNCDSSISAFNAKRKAKRTLPMSDVQTVLDLLSIAKSTCVLAPEVMEGPYYINNEFIRNNLTENQGGIYLTLDIAVIDVTTCEPMEDVLVEIWGANATGVYSGYTAMMGGKPPGTGDGHKGHPGKGKGGHGPHLAEEGDDEKHRVKHEKQHSGQIPTEDKHRGPQHGPKPGPGGPGGEGRGGFPGATLTRNETFLRGGYPTGSDGLTELLTVYPGFYAGRTAHIHTMIHMNWEKSENGTFVSSSGSVLHVGQFFFDDSWNDKVYATSPYMENPNKRTYNDEDRTVGDSEDADGNSAFIDLHLAGEDITGGVIGFITVGVNPKASYPIKNKNYLNSTGPSP